MVSDALILAGDTSHRNKLEGGCAWALAHIYFYALGQIFVLSRRICWLHFRLQHISYWRISLRFLERKWAPHKSLGAVDVQLIGGLDLLHVKNGSL